MEILILLILGIFTLILTGCVIFKKGFAEAYVQKSPKAFIWRKIFGEEKAIKMVKGIFAPIGFALGCILVFLGLYQLALTL